METKILIVEDDADIQALLVATLKKSGFIPLTVDNGLKAIEVFREQPPHLVLLDVDLPDITGFEVCKNIRSFSNIPVIFISNLSDGSDIIRGLELGGDDYITKPFDIHQLIARVRSNLRRASALIENEQESGPEDIQIGGYQFRFEMQRCYINGQELYLSLKEYLILFTLAHSPGEIFRATDLYYHIWGSHSLGDTRTLKVHVSNTRRKLETVAGAGHLIETVRGVGYRCRG